MTLIGLHPGWQVDKTDNIICDGCGKRIDDSGAYRLDPNTDKTYAVGSGGSHVSCDGQLEKKLAEAGGILEPVRQTYWWDS